MENKSAESCLKKIREIKTSGIYFVADFTHLKPLWSSQASSRLPPDSRH
jgi:hypothetical protein